MLSAEDFGKIFSPHRGEMIRLSEEIDKAVKIGNGYYASECADRLYSLMLDNSLIVAEFISDLEERLEKDPARRENSFIPRVIESARICYADLNDALKRILKEQQKYGLTNIPEDE